ncbi:hypothetical protein Drorol1_Dr00008318 [Drosera rotundifolia]
MPPPPSSLGDAAAAAFVAGREGNERRNAAVARRNTYPLNQRSIVIMEMWEDLGWGTISEDGIELALWDDLGFGGLCSADEMCGEGIRRKGSGRFPHSARQRGRFKVMKT